MPNRAPGSDLQPIDLDNTGSAQDQFVVSGGGFTTDDETTKPITRTPLLDLDRAYYNLPPAELRTSMDRALAEKSRVVISMQTLAKMYPKDPAKAAEAFAKRGGELVSKPGISVDDIDGGLASQYMKSGLPVTFNVENLIHGDPAATAKQWQPAFKMMVDQGYRPRIARETLRTLYPNDPQAEKRAALKGWDVYDTGNAADMIQRIPRQEPADTAYFALDESKAKEGKGGRFRLYISAGKAKESEKVLSGLFGGTPRTVYAIPLSQLPADLKVEYQADGQGSVSMEGAVADLPKNWRPWNNGLKRFFAVDGKSRVQSPDVATGEYIFNVFKDPNKSLWQKGWTTLMGYSMGTMGTAVEEVGNRMQQTAEIASMGLRTQVSPKDQKAVGRFSVGALRVLGESIGGIGRAAREIATPETADAELDYLKNVATFGIPAIYKMAKSTDYRMKRGADPWDAAVRSVEEALGPMVKAGNRAAAIVYAKPAMLFGLAEALYSGSLAAVTGQEEPGTKPENGNQIDQFRARPISTAFSLFGIPAAGLKGMGFSDEFAQEAEGILMLAAMDGVMRASHARAQYKAETPARIAKLSAEAEASARDILNSRREIYKTNGETPPPWLDEKLTPLEAVRQAQASISAERDAGKAAMADNFLRTALGDEFVKDIQAPTAEVLRIMAEIQNRQTATGGEAAYYRGTKPGISEEAARRAAAEEEIAGKQKFLEGRPFGGETKSAEASAREFQLQQGGKTAAETAQIIKEAGGKLPGEVAAEKTEGRTDLERKAMLSREVGQAVGKSAQESARTMQGGQRAASHVAETFMGEKGNRITPRQIVEDVRAGRLTVQQGAELFKQLHQGLLDITKTQQGVPHASKIPGNQKVGEEGTSGLAAPESEGKGVPDLRGNAETGGAALGNRGGEGAAPEGIPAQGKAKIPKAKKAATESAASEKKSSLTLNQQRTLSGLIEDGKSSKLTQGGLIRDSKGQVVGRFGTQSGYSELYRHLFSRGGKFSKYHKEAIFKILQKALDGEPLNAKQQRIVDTALSADKTLNAEAYRNSMVSQKYGPDEVADAFPALEEKGYAVISARNLRVGDTFTHAKEKFTVTAIEDGQVEVQDGAKFKIDAERDTFLIDEGSLRMAEESAGETLAEPKPAAEVPAAGKAEAEASPSAENKPTASASAEAAPVASDSLTIRGQEFKYSDMPDVYKRMSEKNLREGARNGEAWPQLELKHRGLTGEKAPLSEKMRDVADQLEAKSAEYRKKTGAAGMNPWADPNEWGRTVYGLASELVRGAAHVVDFATWSAHAIKQFGEVGEEKLRRLWDEANRLAEAAGWKRPETMQEAIQQTGEVPPVPEKTAEAVQAEADNRPFRPGSREEVNLPEPMRKLETPAMPEKQLRMGNVVEGTKTEITEWSGVTLEKAVHALRELKGTLAPTSEVTPRQLDVAYKMKAPVARAEIMLDLALTDLEKWFDKAGEQTAIEFFDRHKLGMKQPDPNLQAFSDLMQELGDNLWSERQRIAELRGQEDPAYKEHHERVIWKVLPAKEGEIPLEKKAPMGRRQLPGSMGWKKQSTCDTLSAGLDRGGVPVTYNPVTMFKIDYLDQLRYISAHHMLDAYLLNGDVVKAKYAPEGFSPVKDPMFQIHPKSPERYYAATGVARLLDNYVSPDNIRSSVIGRTALDLKNAYTMTELALNGFHFTFETMESIVSQTGMGLKKLVNMPGHRLEALGDISKSIYTPIENYRIGAKVFRSFTEPDFWNTPDGKWLEANIPEARTVLGKLFEAGGQPKMPGDFRTGYRKAFMEAIEKGKISAIPKGIMALNEAIMTPLFDNYIPRIKLGVFMKEGSAALAENAGRIQAGNVSRETVLRNVWRFTEDRFGELNYDNQFWDRTFKTAMQLMFRSVTWKLGNLRGILGAGPEQFRELKSAYQEGRRPLLTQKMAWLAGLSLWTAAAGSATMYAFTGKWPQELKDFVFPQVDPKDPNVRINIPTYWKDIIHMSRSPITYLQSSLSGDLMRMADVWANRDYFGNMVYDPEDPLLESAWNIFKHVLPIPISVSSAMQLAERKEPYHLRMMSFLGFNEAPGYVEQSPGMRGAREWMRGMLPAMGRTPEQVRRGKLSWKVQQSMLHDQPLDKEDQDAFDAMPEVWQKRVLQNASKLPEVSVFLRLPAKQAVKFFDGLTDEEKLNVGELIYKKINNNQTMTDEQKQSLWAEYKDKTAGLDIPEPNYRKKKTAGSFAGW